MKIKMKLVVKCLNCQKNSLPENIYDNFKNPAILDSSTLQISEICLKSHVTLLPKASPNISNDWAQQAIVETCRILMTFTTCPCPIPKYCLISLELSVARPTILSLIFLWYRLKNNLLISGLWRSPKSTRRFEFSSRFYFQFNRKDSSKPKKFKNLFLFDHAEKKFRC